MGAYDKSGDCATCEGQTRRAERVLADAEERLEAAKVSLEGARGLLAAAQADLGRARLAEIEAGRALAAAVRTESF